MASLQFHRLTFKLVPRTQTIFDHVDFPNYLDNGWASGFLEIMLVFFVTIRFHVNRCEKVTKLLQWISAFFITPCNRIQWRNKKRILICLDG